MFSLAISFYRWYELQTSSSSSSQLSHINKQADYLRVYILYTSNYSAALETLNNCMKSNPEFVKFLQSEKVTKQLGKADVPDLLVRFSFRSFA